MKYILVAPSKDRTAISHGFDIAFFVSIGYNDQPKDTYLLSEAHVFEYEPEVMQHALDSMWQLVDYSAIPIQDVDIFKAKLAGK
jgi:hypothetical protein